MNALMSSFEGQTVLSSSHVAAQTQAIAGLFLSLSTLERMSSGLTGLKYTLMTSSIKGSCKGGVLELLLLLELMTLLM